MTKLRVKERKKVVYMQVGQDVPWCDREILNRYISKINYHTATKLAAVKYRLESAYMERIVTQTS